MKHRLILGQWNCICDRCGFKFKSPELRKDWQNLMVCSACFELRNQQDFLRIKPEKVAPPWVRPQPPDSFVLVPYICKLESSNAITGVGIAGCAVVGTFNPPFVPGFSAIAGKALAGKAITGTL